MKRKLIVLALAVEAILCVVLTLVKAPVGDALVSLLSFPFAQIGLGLRALSLSGTVGNLLALVLYLAICLLPIAAFVLIHRKRALVWEDALLFVLSALLFAAIYFMVNPGAIVGVFHDIPSGKGVLGSTIYSVLIAYLILRLLRISRTGGAKLLQHYLSILLGLLSAILVYQIFGAGVTDLVSSITALKQGNSGNEALLGASYAFAFLQYAVNALPFVFDILVALFGMRLLRQMVENRFSEEAVLLADRLSRLCGVALQASVLAVAALNLLQLLFAKFLFNIDTSAQIPLFSIAFVLAALLLSRLIAENKLLKEDNDSII